MRKVLQGFERGVTAVFTYMTATMLFALMVLTCVDVLGRYFFNNPVYGGLELTEILLAGVIFFALPLASYAGQHILVDLFTPTSPVLRAVQGCVTNLICALSAAVVSNQLWLRAQRLERAGETTIQIQIPIYLVAYAISILVALAALAFLVRAFHPKSRVNVAAEIQN